jgi:hypothetical protein
VVIAQIDEKRWFMMIGISPPGQWKQEPFNDVLESISFFNPDTEGLPEVEREFLPTSTPVPIDEGEELNEAGFIYTPPEGWETALNVGTPAFDGTATLFPEGTDPQEPDVSIVLNLGSTLLFMPGEVEQEADATPDMLLDAFVNAEGSNVTLQNRRDIQIDALEGRGADVTIESSEQGPAEGQVAIVRADEQRWFMVLGIAPPGEWTPEPFDKVLETIRFFETTGPHMAEAETTEDTIFPMPDSASGVLVFNQGQSVNFQATMSIDEAMAFYREQFTQAGATERTALSIKTDNSFSLTFDGWPQASGKQVYVQGIVLDALQININVRLIDERNDESIES